MQHAHIFRRALASLSRLGMVLGGKAQFLQIENPFVAVDCLYDQRRAGAGWKSAPECLDDAGRIFSFKDAEEIEAEEKSKTFRQSQVLARERIVDLRLDNREMEFEDRFGRNLGKGLVDKAGGDPDLVDV